MLHLAYANRMELLVEPLVARIAASQRADPMAPVPIIVPNRAVGQFVRFRVAEALGIAANLQFEFLRSALTAAVETDDLQVVDVDALTLVLYARFLDDGFLDANDLGPVRAYLGADSDRAIRALQLAEQVARLFEEYGYSRQQMLRSWRHGPVLAETPWARTEAWQGRLHRALFAADGALDIAGRADAGEQLALIPGAVGPRRMLLTDALRAVHPSRLDLPNTLHVFGLSYVAPAFAEVFARVAHGRTLAVYALNPCLEFWEDVEHVPAAERAGWAHQGDKLPGLDGEDPFALDQAGDTPGLRLWGRPGREYVRLLNQLSDCVFDAAFADPLAGGDSLLGRLQRDILVRAPERAWVDEGVQADDSIRFLACPGVRREVEIVADEIWALVAGGLRFHEIAVMVTDARREDYLTHVHSVFRERHALPYNVIDGSLSAQTRVIEAIDRLLDLPTSDFAYGDLRPLLLHPAIGGALDGGDPARWRKWLDALQIRFGADREDLRDTYLDRDVHNWDQACVGWSWAASWPESAGDPTPFSVDAGEWLPFEPPPDDGERVAVLVDLARRLITDAKALAAAELTVSEWAVLLTRFIAPVQTADLVDEIALSRCLQALEAMGARTSRASRCASPSPETCFVAGWSGWTLDGATPSRRCGGLLVAADARDPV